MSAEKEVLARIEEVLDMYESCGPKQQSTRDVLAAIREAMAPRFNGSCIVPGCQLCGPGAVR